jgi:hypothetical protein
LPAAAVAAPRSACVCTFGAVAGAAAAGCCSVHVWPANVARLSCCCAPYWSRSAPHKHANACRCVESPSKFRKKPSSWPTLEPCAFPNRLIAHRPPLPELYRHQHEGRSGSAAAQDGAACCGRRCRLLPLLLPPCPPELLWPACASSQPCMQVLHSSVHRSHAANYLAIHSAISHLGRLCCPCLLFLLAD